MGVWESDSAEIDADMAAGAELFEAGQPLSYCIGEDQRDGWLKASADADRSN